MKVKSESEVALSCPTLSDLMDYSPSGPSIHGIFQARVLEWVAIAFSINYYSNIISDNVFQKYVAIICNMYFIVITCPCSYKTLVLHRNPFFYLVFISSLLLNLESFQIIALTFSIFPQIILLSL